jgi:hypothetical protein
MPENRKSRDTSLEKDSNLRSDEQGQPDELGNDPAQVGPRSAGQSGSSQSLSHATDANEASVEELSDTNQAFESAAVEGVEDAAEYGRTDDVPPNRKIA